MTPDSTVLTVTGEYNPLLLDGETFQIHTLSDNKIRLYRVRLAPQRKCPVIIGGEPCCLEAGHTGKHIWSSAD